MSALSRRRRSGGGAPVVANQTFEFGQKTLSNAGNAAVVNAGIGLVSASIDSGSTNATTHFNVTVVGGTAYIRSNQNGSLTNTPYTLNMTFTGTNGASDTATMTINTSGNDANGRNLANAFSVSPGTSGSTSQLETVLARTSAPQLTYGDYVLCRSGFYEGLGAAGASRGTAFSGTFSPPDQYLSVPGTQPTGHRGWDIETNSGGAVNWVTVCPHASATPQISRLYLLNTSAGYAGLRFTELTFTRSDEPADVTEPGTVTNLDATNAPNAGYLIFRNNTWSWTCVDNCTFQGMQTATGATCNTFIGIVTTSNHPNLIIRDNTFDTVWNACHITTGAATTHNALQIIGNTVTNCWSDVFFLKHGDDVKVNWNLVYNAKQSYLALKFFSTVWDTSLHKDTIHARATASGTAGAANFQCIGNRIYRGSGSAASYPAVTSDGPSNYDGESGTAIFIENPSASGVYTDPIVEGNLVVGESPANKIVFNTATGGTIRKNTVVTHDPGNYGGTFFDTAIKLNAGTGTVTVEHNVTEDIDDTGTGNTIGDNTIISRTATSGALSRSSVFVSAEAQQGSEISGTGTDTHFAIDPDGEAGTASPVHGHGEVDYANRSLALSYY